MQTAKSARSARLRSRVAMAILMLPLWLCLAALASGIVWLGSRLLGHQESYWIMFLQSTVLLALMYGLLMLFSATLTSPTSKPSNVVDLDSERR